MICHIFRCWILGCRSYWANHLRTYEKECPYTKVVSPNHHSGSLATHSSSSTSGSTNSSSVSLPPHHSPVLDRDVLKTVPQDDVIKAPFSIKDKMSQSSENNIDNFIIRHRVEAIQEEASISGGMKVIQTSVSPNPAPIQPADLAEAARAEAAYQEELVTYATKGPSVVITSKTKPRESLVPLPASAAPLSTGILAILIPSMLKRMAKEIPASTSRPSKRTKTSAPKQKPLKSWFGTQGRRQLSPKWVLWLDRLYNKPLWWIWTLPPPYQTKAASGTTRPTKGGENLVEVSSVWENRKETYTHTPPVRRGNEQVAGQHSRHDATARDAVAPAPPYDAVAPLQR
ncbi:hypothetical protein LIER_27604 [Lithospermum erythrorhizon]|uniref:Uncharacterized protein n=1 Tax=Lithospermum erythrorhizon TaxID=34254 RepID=A0AAV3RDU5_LITER